MKIFIMKNYILLFGVLFCLDLHSQTENNEKQNLAERFSRGEFTQTEYIQLGKDWKELLTSTGGYPELPYNEESKEIEFKTILSFPGMDKKTIYDRSMEWAAQTFGSLSSVLHYSNPENGKIIIKGWFKVYFKKDVETFFSSKRERVSSVRCDYTSVFTIKDNKEKVEINNITYEYFLPSSYIGNIYVPELSQVYPISYLYPITNNESITWKGNLNLMNETSLHLNSFLKSMERYINNKEGDYNF